MEDKTENTLRIDPETGAVVINDTMWIDPEWTKEVTEESEAYKEYGLRSTTLRIDNVNGGKIVVDIYYWNEKKIKRIEITIVHSDQAETWNMRKADFIVLREILYKSFSGYTSKDSSSSYIRYIFPWGSVLIANEGRIEDTTELTISFRRP